jgi:arylsulfatase A-like enzyme
VDAPRVIAALLALGCVSAPSTDDGWASAELPVRDGAVRPPPLMTLISSAVVPGGTLRLTADGATAGDTVWFARGSEIGEGRCPGVLAGLCLDITRGQPLGAAVADAEGHAELLVPVPALARVDLAVAFQALVFDVPAPYASTTVAMHTTAPGNVLVIMADDMGVDKVGRYGLPVDGIPPTPNLDRLMDAGVRFSRAYTSPSCSPTRAILNTGRQPYQHGVGFALSLDTEIALSYDETTIPEALDERTGDAYAHGYIGKWHLGGIRFDYLDNPNLHGWDTFAGLLVGMKAEHATDGLAMTYNNWERVVNGVPGRSATYMTTHMVDDAIALMDDLPEPWVVVLATFAPHAPYHWPPEDLWSGELLGPEEHDQQYNAAVEAMDTELGRLLDTMSPELAANTTIVFLGDNGTPVDGVDDPFYAERSKETVYEGGVHVPLIVSGPLVDTPGSECDALVHAADVLPTVLDIAGAPYGDEELEALYGRSLVPWIRDPELGGGREMVYAEMFKGPGPAPHTAYLRMVRDDRWKVHQNLAGPDQFFDLEGVLLEGEDLLADGVLSPDEQAAYDRLIAAMPTPLE